MSATSGRWAVLAGVFHAGLELWWRAVRDTNAVRARPRLATRLMLLERPEIVVSCAADRVLGDTGLFSSVELRPLCPRVSMYRRRCLTYCVALDVWHSQAPHQSVNACVEVLHGPGGSTVLSAGECIHSWTEQTAWYTSTVGIRWPIMHASPATKL
jgi:hypothetical protein